MKIESNWRITFDPSGSARVLLEYGDMVDSELAWSLKKTLQVTQLDEASEPFLRHAGNAVVNLAFRVYTDEPVDATGRRNILESLMAVTALVKKPLRVSVRGITEVTGTYWQFSNSYITEHSPLRDVESDGIVRSYSITATGLVRVGV
jgi:hypothetical protein